MYTITCTENKLNKMTQEQIFGVVRHTMTAIGGILIAKGLVADGAWTELTGAAITLAGVIWSIVAKKPAA
jgi:hypothetical protein